MKTQLHTTISRRSFAVYATVVAGLCLAAPSTSAAKAGPDEYVAPAVMRTGTYLRVHPNRHVLVARKLHGTIYLARHILLDP